VQAIGGATLKIEGFYDVCRAMPGGLTGEQGVIVPAANVPNLMLREDVADAVAAGQFHIYPVRTIDEGIELLTGIPAGERAPVGAKPDGAYPPDSVNGRIEGRLRELAEKNKETNGNTKKDGKTEKEEPQEEPKPEPPAEPELPGEQPEPAEGEKDGE
ncbi:MAG: hypothetical protein MUC51_10905, partial [Anaerolineae bacterium]|nr:hypothetical protein [Anaerolineae bacterium]